MDQIKIQCTSAIPALSIAKISSYSAANQLFTVIQPDADNLSLQKLVFVPEAIPADTPGWGMYKHIGVLKKSGTVVATDLVGSENGEWTVKTFTGGNLYVLSVLTNNVIVRPVGGGGSSSSLWAKVKTPILSHASISEYTVILIDSSGAEAGGSFTIDRALGYKGFGSDGEDIRNYVPWFGGNAIIPVVQHYDVDAAAAKWFIDLALTFVGKPADKSIDVEEITTSSESLFRTMGVYR